MRPPRAAPRVLTPGQAAQNGPPFGEQFQGMLFRSLIEDGRFAQGVGHFVGVGIFSYPVFAWAWGRALEYAHEYGPLPSFPWLIDTALRELGPQGQVFAQALHMARTTPITDEQWLRDKTLDWIRRAVFRKAYQDVKPIFDSGDAEGAYDLMQEAMDKVRNVEWANPDRGFLAEELTERHVMRQESELRGGARIPTGIAQLDKLIGGGAEPGFLGTWLAYPKHGKTTTLINLGYVGFNICRQRTLHLVFEGSRKMIEDRYDTIAFDEAYAATKRGDVEPAKYAQAVREAQALRGLCITRGFTDTNDAGIIEIDRELKELRTTLGWSPKLIIVDYADLVRGRVLNDQKRYLEETSVYQDLKLRAARHEAVIWTASQAQRPDKNDWDVEQTTLTSDNISGAYAKVRVADFVGSINQSVAERDSGWARLHVELCRDSPSHQTVAVRLNFSRMLLSGTDELPPGHAPPPMNGHQGNGMTKPLGYNAIQLKNGV